MPNNYTKRNEEKCHVITFGGMHDDIRVKIGTSVIKETREQMLLGISIDNKLTFKSHVERSVRRLPKNYMLWLELRIIWKLNSLHH